MARGLSQEELARRAGVNRSTVSRLEHGLEEPLSRTKDRLARALEQPTALLFPLNDDDRVGSAADRHDSAGSDGGYGPEE